MVNNAPSRARPTSKILRLQPNHIFPDPPTMTSSPIPRRWRHRIRNKYLPTAYSPLQFLNQIQKLKLTRRKPNPINNTFSPTKAPLKPVIINPALNLRRRTPVSLSLFFHQSKPAMSLFPCVTRSQQSHPSLFPWLPLSHKSQCVDVTLFVCTRSQKWHPSQKCVTSNTFGHTFVGGARVSIFFQQRVVNGPRISSSSLPPSSK